MEDDVVVAYEDGVAVAVEDDRENSRHEGENEPEGVADHVVPGMEGGHCDPRRMALSEQEHEWAMSVKAAIEGSPEIDNLSDFMYVQLAVVHQGNLANAVESASRLQQTRQDYSLLDTYEEGIRIQQKMVQLFPGMYLSFTYAPEEGCFVLVFDITKLDQSILNCVEKTRTWIASCFYNFHSFSPDFQSIRNGCIYIAECQDYRWKANMVDYKTAEIFWGVIGSVYPLTITKMRCFHTPMVFNVLFSMTKRLVPSEFSTKFQVGCQYEGRLDSLYFVPTPEAATQRLLGRFAECLKRRYENEKAFKL